MFMVTASIHSIWGNILASASRRFFFSFYSNFLLSLTIFPFFSFSFLLSIFIFHVTFSSFLGYPVAYKHGIHINHYRWRIISLHVGKWEGDGLVWEGREGDLDMTTDGMATYTWSYTRVACIRDLETC